MIPAIIGPKYHIILYEGEILSQQFDIVALYTTIMTNIELAKKREMNLFSMLEDDCVFIPLCDEYNIL